MTAKPSEADQALAKDVCTRALGCYGVNWSEGSFIDQVRLNISCAIAAHVQAAVEAGIDAVRRAIEENDLTWNINTKEWCVWLPAGRDSDGTEIVTFNKFATFNEAMTAIRNPKGGA